MSEWAKGPWRVSHDENDALTFNGQKPVAVLDAEGWAVACNTTYYPTGLDARNAHLIAAAPDLYEALEALRQETWLIIGVNHPAIASSEAALAKARGEA